MVALGSVAVLGLSTDNLLVASVEKDSVEGIMVQSTVVREPLHFDAAELRA